VVLRAELVDVDKLVDTNALVSGHLDVAQQRVGELIDTAEAFQKDLLAARNSANGGNIIGQAWPAAKPGPSDRRTRHEWTAVLLRTRINTASGALWPY